MPLRYRAVATALLVAASVVVPSLAVPAEASQAPASACHGCPPPAPLPGGAWHPARGDRWQIQLQAVAGHCATGGYVTDVSGVPWTGGAPVEPDVYAIDLYADDGRCPHIHRGTRNHRAVAALHDSGRRAIAYISAGSWEAYRPDARAFVRYDRRCDGCLLGKTLGEFPDERYVNIHDPATRRFLLGRQRIRMRRAAAAGFDGVYFDNQDEYHWADTGFPIDQHDQLMYLTRLINIAHHLGLAAGPNNDIVQTARFLPYADLQINESCHRFHECRFMMPMLKAGKPVFQIEYRHRLDTYCPSANRLGFSTIKKQPALYDLPWVSCR